MTRPLRLLEIGLYALAAALVAAAFAWPSWSLQGIEAHTRQTAQAALEHIADAEQALEAKHRAYAAFGPAPGELQAALPGLDLGPAGADFAFDALPDPAGALRIRAVSRPEAIRARRAAPLVMELVLKDGARMNQ